MRICPQISDHNKMPSNADSTTKSIDSAGTRHNISNVNTYFTLQEKRLLARLSKRVETVSPLLRRRWELVLGTLKLDVRQGPSITRRWSQQGQEMFSREGQALAITLDCDRFISQRFTLVLCIMQHASAMSRLTLTSHLSLKCLVPSQNPNFTAIRLGDIDHIKRMMMAEPAALSTVIRGGYTLLHVSRYALYQYFISNNLFSVQHAMVDTIYYPFSWLMVRTSTPRMTVASKYRDHRKYVRKY